MATPDRLENGCDSSLLNRPVDSHHVAPPGERSSVVASDVIPQESHENGRDARSSLEAQRPKSYSLSSSAATNFTSSTQVENRAEHCKIRTLPRQSPEF